MGWARFDDKRHTSHKLAAAGGDNAMKGLAANGLDANGITYCAANETDGFIPDSALVIIGPGTTPAMRRDLTTRLVTVGRWSRDDEAGGFWIHNYLEFNPSKVELDKRREEERNKKQAWRDAKRDKALSRGGPTGTTARVPEGQSDVSTGDTKGCPPGSPGGVHQGVPSNPTRPDPTRISSQVSSGGPPGTGGQAAGEGDPLVERWLGALPEVRPKDRDEASQVVAHLRAHVDPTLIDEAIGYCLELERPPRTAGYLLKTVRSWARQRDVEIPGLAS